MLGERRVERACRLPGRGAPAARGPSRTGCPRSKTADRPRSRPARRRGRRGSTRSRGRSRARGPAPRRRTLAGDAHHDRGPLLVLVRVGGFETELHGGTLCCSGGRARPSRPGARAQDRVARLRRERRRAPERLRRLRPARAAGRHRARAGDEGEAQPRRGARDRGRRARRRRASRRRASTTRRAAAAASRISPTRPRSRPSTPRSRTRCGGSAGSPSRRSSRSCRAESVFHYRNKMEYSFTPDAGRARRSASTSAGRWDEVLDIERCWLTTDLGNAIRNAVARLGARGAARGLRPGRPAPATCATSSCARAGTPARRSSSSSRAPGERFDRDELGRGADARFPRCARSTGRSTTRPPR